MCKTNFLGPDQRVNREWFFDALSSNSTDTNNRDVRVQILIWFQTFLLFAKSHFQTFNALKTHLCRHFILFQTFSNFFSYTLSHPCNNFLVHSVPSTKLVRTMLFHQYLIFNPDEYTASDWLHMTYQKGIVQVGIFFFLISSNHCWYCIRRSVLILCWSVKKAHRQCSDL